MSSEPLQRVSSIPTPVSYELPGRPESGSPQTDAYRQTQFLLGADLDLFDAAMNLQLGLFQDAQPSQYRTHQLAAIAGLWSRSFMYLRDSMLLLTRGSYASTLPLIRTIVETIAAQEGLRDGEMEEHQNWLSSTLRPDEEYKAYEFALGNYYAGSKIAEDPALQSIYRPAADLARPNFGATLLQVGPESNNQRLALTFGDTAFHDGWAELICGWLLTLAIRQCATIIGAPSIFPVSETRLRTYESLNRRIEAALSKSGRCRLEEVMEGGDRRYLVHNFRRASSGSPRKILL